MVTMAATQIRAPALDRAERRRDLPQALGLRLAVWSTVGLLACEGILGIENARPWPETCALTSDCPAGLICAFERCHAECREDRDCDDGDHCLRDSSSTELACITDDEIICTDCPDDVTCTTAGCWNTCAHEAPCPPMQECIDAVCSRQNGDTGGASRFGGAGGEEHLGAGGNSETAGGTHHALGGEGGQVIGGEGGTGGERHIEDPAGGRGGQALTAGNVSDGGAVSAGAPGSVSDAGAADNYGGVHAGGSGQPDLVGPGAACDPESPCATLPCVDGRCCTQSCETCETCTGPDGTCIVVPVGLPDVSPASTCEGTQTCDGFGNCKLANGESCENDALCSSGYCVGGLCCNLECNDGCGVCNSADNKGTCVSCSPARECRSGICSLVPTMVSYRISEPYDIAVDSAYVYWTVRDPFIQQNGAVLRLELALTTSGWPDTFAASQNLPGEILYGNNNLFWIEQDYGRVHVRGEVNRTVTGLSYPLRIVADHDFIYSTHTTGIGRASIRSEHFSRIVPGPIDLPLLAVDNTEHVYFSSNGSVLKVSRDGGSPVQLAPQINAIDIEAWNGVAYILSTASVDAADESSSRTFVELTGGTELVVGNNTLYIAAGLQIVEVPLNGGAASKAILSSSSQVSYLTLFDDRVLYWMSSGTLFRALL